MPAGMEGVAALEGDMPAGMGGVVALAGGMSAGTFSVGVFLPNCHISVFGRLFERFSGVSV